MQPSSLTCQFSLPHQHQHNYNRLSEYACTLWQQTREFVCVSVCVVLAAVSFGFTSATRVGVVQVSRQFRVVK